MEKKIVELIIGEDGLNELGVDAIALVENPAIEENFLYFKEEKFVEPKAGEEEGDFIGRCMSAIESEFPDQEQRLAVCYSYWRGSEEKFLRENPCLPGYVAYGTKIKDGKEVPNCIPDESSKQFADLEFDVLGYATENFDICPIAINLFKKIMDREIDEDEAGMIRSAALQADAIFGIEKEVMEKELATREDVAVAVVIAKDFIDLIHEIGELHGEFYDTDFMDGHINTILSYVPDEEFDFDPSGLPPYVSQIDEEEDEEEKLIRDILANRDKFGAMTEDLINALDEYSLKHHGFATNTDGYTRSEIEAMFRDPKNRRARKYRTPVYEYAYKEGKETPIRKFCSDKRDKFYFYTDILAMKQENSEFGHNGRPYSKWSYKGGPYCAHAWRKYTWSNDKNRLEDVGWVDGIPGQAPIEMQYQGRYPTAAVRRSSGNFSAYHFNEDKRIVTGPAMIPDYKMARRADDGSKYYVYFTEDTIRDINEKFMREKRTDQTNIEHDSEDIRTDNYIYESWIIEDPEMDKAKAMGFSFPKGTWMVSMRVMDERSWELIKEGKLKGFSVEGLFGEMVQKDA